MRFDRCTVFRNSKFLTCSEVIRQINRRTDMYMYVSTYSVDMKHFEVCIRDNT